MCAHACGGDCVCVCVCVRTCARVCVFHTFACITSVSFFCSSRTHAHTQMCEKKVRFSVVVVFVVVIVVVVVVVVFK